MIGRIASWVVWTLLTIVFAMFVYRQSDVVKPASAGTSGLVNQFLVSTSDSGRLGADNKLTSAREALSRGQTERAISQYQEYIASHSKDVDARGELGNLYYSTGRVVEAADVYYDTAKLLMENRKLERVSALLPAIAEAKPRLARELRDELRNEISPGPFPTSTVVDRSPQSALTRY